MSTFYVDKFNPALVACSCPADYSKLYQRASSLAASIILGRSFNETLESHLDKNPSQKAFFQWWHQYRELINANAHS